MFAPAADYGVGLATLRPLGSNYPTQEPWENRGRAINFSCAIIFRYHHDPMPADIKDLARLGAQARLAEIAREIDSLHRAFPDLPVPRRRGRPPRYSAANATVDKREPTRRRRNRNRMSAAARRAVSVRMKKYWAARRKANG
jgi:hypothetical protein